MICQNNKKCDQIDNQNLELNKKKEIQDSLVNTFNLVVINMIRHITEYYGDPNMVKLQLVLEDIIIKTPDEPIACFLLNVYKNDDYRHNILKQNDKFFMDEIDKQSLTISDYDQDNNQNNDQNNQEQIVKMFEFKTLWQHIDTDTKCFIKKSMMGLVKICQKYIFSL
jgi:predicted methyltransferase